MGHPTIGGGDSGGDADRALAAFGSFICENRSESKKTRD